jgi:hypothetical protein
MKPTPFDPAQHLAPTPFDERHCAAAARLKEAGLPWTPHVGCFVWDHEAHIEVSSPFPSRVYFILNLGHFLKRFGTLEAIAERLVWLPTWHQARHLCDRYDAGSVKAVNVRGRRPGNELLELYERLWRRLRH